MKSIIIFCICTALLIPEASGQHAFLIDYFGPEGNMYKIGLYSPIPETLKGPCQPFPGDAEFDGDNLLFALSGQGPEFYQIDTTTAAASIQSTI